MRRLATRLLFLVAFVAVIVVAMIFLHAILLWFQSWYWPETGKGYAIGSSWAGATVILTGSVAWGATYWKKHNCHVHGCMRLQWHVHPDHGHPVCKTHHPDGRAPFLHKKFHDFEGKVFHRSTDSHVIESEQCGREDSTTDSDRSSSAGEASTASPQ